MKDIIEKHLAYSRARLQRLIAATDQWRKYIANSKRADTDVSGEYVSTSDQLQHSRAGYQIRLATTTIVAITEQISEQAAYVVKLSEILLTINNDNSPLNNFIQAEITGIEETQQAIDKCYDRITNIKANDIPGLARLSVFVNKSSFDQDEHFAAIKSKCEIEKHIAGLQAVVNRHKIQLFDFINPPFAAARPQI